MSFGIEIKNILGDLQISDSTTNYHVVASGSASVGSDGSYAYILTSIPHETGDLVFLSASLSYMNLEAYVYDNSGNTAIAVRSWNNFSLSSTTYQSGTVYWKLAKDASYLAPSTSGFGLEVYDAQGDVAYTTEEQAIIVLGTITGYTPVSASLTTGEDTKVLAYNTRRLGVSSDWGDFDAATRIQGVTCLNGGTGFGADYVDHEVGDTYEWEAISVIQTWVGVEA